MGRESSYREAVELFVLEVLGVNPGKGTLRVEYELAGVKMAGKGYSRCGRIISAGRRMDK